ncbi:MAG: outer membrane beta-barrel family protein [Odoribacter sp.]|nr:outer membrane beta-barrel family protein [Odoribacter sp.]
MKKLFVTLMMIIPLAVYARNDVKTDSVTTELNELVVTADVHTETAHKVILRPTELEKKHSTNGYTLLENINLPEFNVDASALNISTVTGRNVIILVNGVEVQSDELATLAASEIVQIDYQRNPGGRYAGSGAVLNFITMQYDFGGNVYISAKEGLARQYGNYAGMVNYKKNSITFTFTANGKWDNFSQLNSTDNVFKLNDGELIQSIIPAESKTSTNSQYVNFKFAHASENHSFDVAVALTRSATPKHFMADNITYTGLYNLNTIATRFSKEHGISPVMKMHYNLYIPGGHTIMAIATLRHGHTDFRSKYMETDVDEAENNTKENNVLASATFGYFKHFTSGISLGTTVDEYYNYYRDVYSGSFTGKQILKNNHTMAMLHLDQNLQSGLSYYLSAGITDLYSTIGEHKDNQLAPMVFYGVTYAMNQKHSVSVTGNYAHSIYSPAYKNDVVIKTSFFEATMGNPDLEQLNAFQNMVSYNGRVGHFGLSFTYDFLKYFDNTSNRYFAEDNIMYHQLVNDGNFSYNKLIFGLSANLFDNKFRLKGNVTFSNNRFDSRYRPAESKDWRADFNASYMNGDWQITGWYALPYSVLGINGTKIHNPAQYGFSLNWQKGNWAAEICVENFLNRRMCIRENSNYCVYKSISRASGDQKGRNISLSVTYILPYGKKTDTEDIETETNINSAILRPF